MFVCGIVIVVAIDGRGRMVSVNDALLEGNHEIPNIEPPIVTFITESPETLV